MTADEHRDKQTEESPFDLTDRVAFVTGAGSGIGRATALVLARHGASVACADVDGETAGRTAAEINETGHAAIAIPTDISVQEQVNEAVAKTVSEFGRLDILANVAGITGRECSLIEADSESIDKTIATNLKGTLWGCQAAARVMREAGTGGSIINLSSTAYDMASAHNAIYGLTKAAVAFLTRSVAAELAPDHIRVNAIAPAAVLTAMSTRHFSKDGVVDETMKQGWIQAMKDMTPLGVVGMPEDIAYTILYLASDASRLITGQIIRTNGGVTRPA